MPRWNEWQSWTTPSTSGSLTASGEGPDDNPVGTSQGSSYFGNGFGSHSNGGTGYTSGSVTTPAPTAPPPLNPSAQVANSGFYNACFVAGTPILTPYGSQPIESLKPGDRIWSRPEDAPSAPPRIQIVEDTFHRTAATLRLHISGQIIETTAAHPFYVVGRGWIPADDLYVGDRIPSHNAADSAIDFIEPGQPAAPVFNICVSQDHTYFVGSLNWQFSVWAHNAGEGYGSNTDEPFIFTGEMKFNSMTAKEAREIYEEQTVDNSAGWFRRQFNTWWVGKPNASNDAFRLWVGESVGDMPYSPRETDKFTDLLNKMTAPISQEELDAYLQMTEQAKQAAEAASLENNIYVTPANFQAFMSGVFVGFFKDGMLDDWIGVPLMIYKGGVYLADADNREKIGEGIRNFSREGLAAIGGALEAPKITQEQYDNFQERLQYLSEIVLAELSRTMAEMTPHERGKLVGMILYEVSKAIVAALAAAPTGGATAAAYTCNSAALLKRLEQFHLGPLAKKIVALADRVLPLIAKLRGKLDEFYEIAKRLGCFVGETPVWLSAVPAKALPDGNALSLTFGESSNAACLSDVRTAVVIEHVPLGARVDVRNPRPEDFDHSLPEPVAATWRQVSMRITRSDGARVKIQILRPASWVSDLGLTTGCRIRLSHPELRLSGQALIEAIEPCPPIATGLGRVVSGAFVTERANELIRVRFADDSDLVGTPLHPVWAAARQDWVPLGELSAGEHVLAHGQPLSVTAVEPFRSCVAVYNLEVHGEHVYEAGASGVLVHNTSQDCKDYLKAIKDIQNDTKLTPDEAMAKLKKVAEDRLDELRQLKTNGKLSNAQIEDWEDATRRLATLAPSTHGPDVRTLNPVTDPARPVYKQGHAGQPVVDHIRARAAGGHPTDPSNLHVKPWEWNARKGAYEGQLLKARQEYIRQGLTPEQADAVLAQEWEWLMNDVLARPMDPNVLDNIPFPGSR